MDAQKEYFIYLISCFLGGSAPEGRKTDFEKLYKLADIHDVGAVIANELKSVSEEYKPSGEIASRFTQTIGLTVIEFQKRERVYNYIKKLLSDNSVKHIFVKGAVVCNFYPVPEFRTSGDIDIIVGENALPLIKEIAEKDKLIRLCEYTTNVLLLNIDGIDIEIHNNADVGVKYFDDVFSLCDSNDGFTYELSIKEHLLYVICHLAKHIAYRGAGIRMLMDVDVLIRRIGDFDLDDFLTLCETAGVKKTAEGIISLSAYWLKTPVEQRLSLDASPLLSSFERVILDGGSFGYEVSSVPAKYYDGNENPTVFKRLKILLKMAFPSREYLKKCYPYYANNKFLYPVARINRVLDGFSKKKRQAFDAINQIKNNGGSVSSQLEIINELDITFK